MASIRKRGKGYHVQIRKNGYQTLTHTLSCLTWSIYAFKSREFGGEVGLNL